MAKARTQDAGASSRASSSKAPAGSRAPRQSQARIPTGDIRNKMKREEVYRARKADKEKEKKIHRMQAKEQRSVLGDKAPPKQEPETLESRREKDETIVAADDEEIQMDERDDEFASYFNGAPPKTLITTSEKPSLGTHKFVNELLGIFPNSEYYKRGTYELKKICKYAANRGYTNVMVIVEERARKELNGMLLIHLPNGPTATFKLTRPILSKAIRNHGRATAHRAELILNNFTTRVGRRVGRMLAALFDHNPEFRGRRVATFHNQRDFIFFRHHRYIFDNGEKCRLQELGPRFTLKLRKLQTGTFDTKEGEYEWFHRAEMDTSRRRFHL